MAIVCGGFYLNGLMPIITGYAAKNLASAVFVSGREAEDVEALDLNFSVIRFTSNTVNYADKTVTSRFLWGKSTALYREDYGVTLLRGATSEEELRHHAYPISLGERVSEPLPTGDQALSARLKPIAKAFVDERIYDGHPFAFVVLKDGGVVAESYDKGITRDTRLLSWSMAKSFVNALVGIMVKDSLLDIHAPMAIAEWQGDGRKAITLNDLMQMQSGLAWNEDYGSRSDVNIMLHNEEDMGLYAQQKTLEHKPGTHWYYSSGSTNIIVRYLRSKFPTQEAFLSYMHDRLFGALGIRDAIFEQDMSGMPVGSSYLYATAQDFARFGQLFLDNGSIGDKRILPDGWTDYTRRPASDSDDKYGALFWLNRGGKFPNAPKDMYWCDGHDGQKIFIIPSKRLVVVILGYSPKPDHVIDYDTLLKDIIRCSNG